MVIALIDFFLFLVFSAALLWWAGFFRNYLFHRKSHKNAFFGSLILCRARIALSFEILGIILLFFKLSSFGADQTDFNELVANALLYNIHATSELYRTQRDDVPFKLPKNFDTSKLDVPKTLQKGNKNSILNEVDEYIRKASATLAGYFGQRIPECKIVGLSRPIDLLSTSPDSELVNLELARLSRQRGACEELIITEGISAELLYRSLKEIGIEILGGIFVALAILIKIIEMRQNELKLKNPRTPPSWYWDEKKLRF